MVQVLFHWHARCIHQVLQTKPPGNGYKAEVSGLPRLVEAMAAGTISDIERMDVVTIPLAIFVLGPSPTKHYQCEDPIPVGYITAGAGRDKVGFEGRVAIRWVRIHTVKSQGWNGTLPREGDTTSL